MAYTTKHQFVVSGPIYDENDLLDHNNSIKQIPIENEVIKVGVSVPYYMIKDQDKEEVKKYVLKKMSEQLADYIIQNYSKYVQITLRENVPMDAKDYTGKMCVVLKKDLDHV